MIAANLIVLADLEVAESLPQRHRSALAEEALVHAREASDERLVAFALWDLALALPVEEAAEEIDRAAAAASAIGSSRLLINLYSSAAYNAIKAGTPTRAQQMVERAVPLARELGDPVMLVNVCGNAGLAALFVGQLDRAQTEFVEQVRLCWEHVWPQLAGEGLAGLAAIAAARDDPERAALLLAAARAAGPIADDDVEAHLNEHFFEPARADYGERRWNDAHATGAQLSFEDAITLAMSPCAAVT
jgi:hypothetical protein